jgi:hypothetical protein
MQAKITRYICRWNRRHDGKWPKYPVELPDGSTPPGRIELLHDRLVYELALCRDKTVAVIYALVPMDLAQRLRRWVHRGFRAKEALAISE